MLNKTQNKNVFFYLLHQIKKGLRTLELCVDNLQPDFLYDHIQPVRTDLIQGLWRTLRSPNDSIAHAAYRVLGKLGGSNRKMIVEPQKLSYDPLTPSSSINASLSSPFVNIYFNSSYIELNLDKVVLLFLL